MPTRSAKHAVPIARKTDRQASPDISIALRNRVGDRVPTSRVQQFTCSAKLQFTGIALFAPFAFPRSESPPARSADSCRAPRPAASAPALARQACRARRARHRESTREVGLSFP